MASLMGMACGEESGLEHVWELCFCGPVDSSIAAPSRRPAKCSNSFARDPERVSRRTLSRPRSRALSHYCTHRHEAQVLASAQACQARRRPRTGCAVAAPHPTTMSTLTALPRAPPGRPRLVNHTKRPDSNLRTRSRYDQTIAKAIAAGTDTARAHVCPPNMLEALFSHRLGYYSFDHLASHQLTPTILHVRTSACFTLLNAGTPP